MSVSLYDDVDFIVEIGFSTSGGAGLVPIGSTMSSIVWTDVTDYVRSVSISRGRSNELDDFQTGRATVVLSNGDRRFDPEYASGPYYGSLTPMRPVRIGASYDGGFYQELFMGWVDGWPQSYVGDFDSTVTLNVSDGFKVLNQLTLPHYWDWVTPRVGSSISGATLRRWFRLADGDGAERAFESVGNYSIGYWYDDDDNTTTGDGADSLIVGSENGAMEFNGEKRLQFWSGNLLPNEASIGAEKTVEFWFSTTVTDDGGYGLIFAGSTEETYLAAGLRVASGVGWIEVWVNDLFPFAAQVNTSVGSGAGKLNDGRPHHVVISYNGTTPSFFSTIDGRSMPLSRSEYFQNSRPEVIGGAITDSSLGVDFPNNFIGIIDEVCVYDAYVTTTWALDRWRQGVGRYTNGARTDARIDAILEMAEWMTDGTYLGTGRGKMSGIRTENKTVLDAIKEADEVEQGRLFMDVAGRVRFIGRQDQATGTAYSTSQATFGDGSGELRYTDISTNYDDQRIYNSVTVQRDSGPAITVTDTDSQSQYFIKSSELTGLLAYNDAECLDIANVQLASYAEPQLRVESLTFDPRSAPADLFPIALGFDIGTRITVKRRPQGVGSAISRDVFIESVAHDITPDTWTTTYQLSPVFMEWWIVEDATNGYIDSTFAVGY